MATRLQQKLSFNVMIHKHQYGFSSKVFMTKITLSSEQLLNSINYRKFMHPYSTDIYIDKLSNQDCLLYLHAFSCHIINVKNHFVEDLQRME